MGYERLEKSLTDTIKEEQAKLGFRKEAIRVILSPVLSESLF